MTPLAYVTYAYVFFVERIAFPLICPFHGLRKCVIDGRAVQAPLKVFKKLQVGSRSWRAVVELRPASN